MKAQDKMKSSQLSRLLVQPLNDIGAVEVAKLHWEVLKRQGGPCELVQGILNHKLMFDREEDVKEVRGVIEAGLTELVESDEVLHNPSCLPSLTLRLCYFGENDRELIKKVTTAVQTIWPRAREGQIQGNHDEYQRRRDEDTIRVGVVSSHFREHSVCRALCPTIGLLASDNTHVTLIYTSPVSDHSFASRLLSTVNASVVLPDDIPGARAQITKLKLDVLIFTDVGMDPFTSLLAYARLTPVQMSLWGHHGTSGLDSFDYFLVGDDVEGDEGWQKVRLIESSGSDDFQNSLIRRGA